MFATHVDNFTARRYEPCPTEKTFLTACSWVLRRPADPISPTGGLIRSISYTNKLILDIMKTPFRLQVSEYDCVPTTFVNALSYLFERSEIPPLVIQRVYLYCLDSLSSHDRIGHGTTGFAVQLLAGWLDGYQHRKFSLSAEYLEGCAVHFKPGNRISRCLNRGGAVLLSLTHGGGLRHYVLGINVDAGWLYCFDPYPMPRAKRSEDYEFLETKGPRDPNLRIRLKWLGVSSNKQKFHLGIESERESILVERR